MSDLVRLTRTLHESARGWGRIEQDWGGEPRMTEIGANCELKGTGNEPYQTAFRLALVNPVMGGEREYTITISVSDRRH